MEGIRVNGSRYKKRNNKRRHSRLEMASLLFQSCQRKGISLNISKWKRPSNSAPTQSKCSGLYMICTMAKHDAERKGYDDSLMLDYRNFIAETTSSEHFFIKGNKVFTPTADCFLNGVTRKVVIDICKKQN